MVKARNLTGWLCICPTNRGHSISKLCWGTRWKQGRLHDSIGDVVSSDARAQTFAEFLESVQWHVRPVTLVPDQAPPINPVFNVDLSPFTVKELKRAISKMSSGKACKDYDIPIECFKALASSGDEHILWLLTFCNDCWAKKAFPREWASASVALLYKKGDPCQCDNYRPICLLTIAYKLFAWMLKERLLQVKVDGALWGSQFGFRSGYSTEDAIFIARRRIEIAKAQRNGRITLLALDWRKAF